MRGLLLLTLRGIWFRRTASIAALAVAIVATAAATLGPLYARSAEDSLVRQQLKDAPAANTTFALTTSSAQQPSSTVDELRTGLANAAGTTDLGPWFGPVATRMSIWEIPVQFGRARPSASPTSRGTTTTGARVSRSPRASARPASATS